MARLGLGPGWQCVFANDICTKKASAYRAFFGECPELKVEDVAKLSTKDLPGIADLVWASFPCQDLSLAGNGAGLSGERSGTFKPFWKLITGLAGEGRAPRIVVLENVGGALTSHAGRDFTTIIRSLTDAGYRVGALMINAVHFVPQSRPRLFIIGSHEEAAVPDSLLSAEPSKPWHTQALIKAHGRLPRELAKSWIWWAVPTPTRPIPRLAELRKDAQRNWVAYGPGDG